MTTRNDRLQLEAATPTAPPGPTGWAGVRAAYALARDPKFYPAKLVAEFGDVIRLPVPFMPVVFINHPDHLTHIDIAAADRYRRAPRNAENMRVQASPFHASFFDPDDAEWRRGRKLLQPHFTQRSLVALGQRFTDTIEEEVDSWAQAACTREPLDLAPQLQRLALAALYNAMFSRRIDADVMAGLQRALDQRMAATAMRSITSWLPAWAPRPLQRRGAAADEWLDHHLGEVVADRRAHPAPETDLLTVLLDARYDDGSPLPDAKIRTEMLFLVIGGHETTAAALAWTFALLATHPAIADRVYDEVDRLGRRPVTTADMPQLEYVKASFDEAQRLQGGLVFNPKQAIVDDEIGGYRIPAGTTIVHSNLTLQRDSRFWAPDPNDFRPERWLDGTIDNTAFQIFGRGPRMCLGKRMAYIEALLTIATAFQRYTFTAEPGWTPTHHYRMSMTVKGGVPVQLAKR
jgi:enediyne biosynthesis protein E7